MKKIKLLNKRSVFWDHIIDVAKEAIKSRKKLMRKGNAPNNWYDDTR